MAGISSSTGLISGINTSQIIDGLISIDARPVTLLTNRVTANQAIQKAYADLKTKLSAIATDVTAFTKPSTFLSATAASSNTSILNVTARPTAAPGNYSFTVARTVSTQSAISSGYASATKALGATGTITIGLGGGKVTSDANLSDLNGGAGVSRGSFRVTDASGKSSLVDVSTAITLDDVAERINSASDIQVKATVGSNGLVLTDTSGGAGHLKVADSGKTTTATDLGLAGTATTTTYAGSSINTIGRATLLSSLNDGLGIRVAGTSTSGTGVTTNKPDLNVTLADGTSLAISLAGQTTLGGVLDAINQAGGTKFTASVGSDGRSINLGDNTTGSHTFSVADASGSHAYEDLGLQGAVTRVDEDGSHPTLLGGPIRASLGSVLIKNLEGGAGLALGQLDLTDRAGTSASVLLTGAQSLSDVIGAINGAGTGLVASVNAAGTGIQIKDNSGGTRDIVIASSRGATASQLGIEGTFPPGTDVVGSNLHRQYVNENSALSDLNGGRGVSAGKFQITNAAGVKATVDTSSAASLGDLISAINSATALHVTASVNADGNGLLLTDTSTGSGTLNVKDLTGTAAANLNIAGSAVVGTNTLNGAYSKTVTITATDSLTAIVNKLNQAGGGVSASVLNDGSSNNGNRLSLSAVSAGLSGQFTLDSGLAGLSLTTLTAAQNAAVFVGSPTAPSPILVQSSSNTVTNVVSGLSLTLVSASVSPVSVNVTQSSDAAVTALTQFVTDVNALTSSVSDQTQFSTDATKKGILLGDATTQSINDTLFNAINTNIQGTGGYNRFAQLGLTIKDGDQLAFDPDAFQKAYDKDPTSLQRVFTAFNTVATTVTTNVHGGALSTSTVTTAFGTDPQGTTLGTDDSSNHYTRTIKLVGFGIGYQLQNAINKLIDPVDGAITKQSATLDKANDQYNARITDLNTLLDAKRQRLQSQFANMESVLGQLQTQQTALNSLSTSSNKSSS